MFFYLLPLMFSSLLGPVLVVMIARYRSSPSVKLLIILILSASLWAFGYAMEVVQQGLEAKILWAKFQYIGITSVPLAWFLFANQYMGPASQFLKLRRNWFILAIIPGITLGLVWTNELHHLVWQEVRGSQVGPLEILEVKHGSWFWVYWVFSYIMMLWGSIRIIIHSLGSNILMRWQTGITVAGAIFPLIGNFLYVTKFNPVRGIDLTPFGFTVAGLLFTIGLFRYQFGKVIPIAQRVVFEEIADGILVLDLQNCIIDLNNAAHQLTGLPYRKVLGMPLARAIPELVDTIENRDDSQEMCLESTTRGSGGQRFFETLIRPLTDQAGTQIGRLVTLHEITRRKHAEAKLQRAHAELEDRVSERTEALQIANLQLESELAERVLAEGRFKDIVDTAPDAVLLVDRDGKILLTNARAETMFGYSTIDFSKINIVNLVPPERKERLEKYRLAYFAQPVKGYMVPEEDSYARRCDGSEFPVEVFVSPLKTSEGILAACIIRDVTLRKQTEREQAVMLQKIRESHKQLHALTARLEEAQEVERRKIAAELHDRVGQNLTALNLNLKIIQNKLPLSDMAPIQARLMDSLDLLEETTREVRSVMAELNPPLLDEYGLLPALRWYFDKFTARTGIPITMTGVEFCPRLSERVEITLYRIIQEVLNNVAKHAQATQVILQCESSAKFVRLTLTDDGKGFNPAETLSTGDQPHWGLLTMKERMASIGGYLSIHSARGKGTRVAAEVRLPEDED